MGSEIGEVYVATPAIEGLPKKLVVVLGRCGETLQVAFVDELAAGHVLNVCGRDFATLATVTGQYNISPYVKAAASDAAIVNDILQAQRERSVA